MALVATLTPPGAAVAGWVKRTLGVEAVKPQRVALGPLPGGGRLLVTGAGGTWIVGRDGARVRLGSYAGATWSPRGLFVGAWRGRRLSAVAPDGRVAWSYGTLGAVRDVRWSPDGYRIAYRSGRAPGAGRRRRQRRERARRDGARRRAGLAPDGAAHARMGPRGRARGGARRRQQPDDLALAGRP